MIASVDATEAARAEDAAAVARGSRWTTPGLAIAVCAACALRVLPFSSRVFAGGGLLPTGDADVYYHLRRIALAARAWPAVPDFDAWMNYPGGGYCPWPPLFDFIPATFAHWTGLPPALVAVWWPPLLGALCVLPFWSLIAAFAGRPAAWCATCLLIVLPAHVAIGTLGRVDHHVAEILLQLWVYAWLARDLSAIERGAPGSRARSFGFGMLLGACLLTWAASLLFLWVVPAAAALWLLPARSERSARAVWQHVSIAFVTAAAIITPNALYNVVRGRAPFAYYHLSLLTLVLCLVLASALPLWAATIAALRAGRPRRALLSAAALPLMASTLLLLPGLRGGLGFVAGDNAFAAQINESLPLMATGFTRTFALQHVGYAHYLLPALTLALVARCFRPAGASGVHVIAALWAINVSVLAFLQARFLYYAAPLAAALPALGYAMLPRLRTPAAALLAAALAPALSFYWRAPQVPVAQIDPARLAFLIEVSNVTPSAGDASDPEHEPRYAVFAPWDLGHPLLAIAERAVVANNFGDQLEGTSFADAQRLYQAARSEADTLAILEARGARYLVTTDAAAQETFAGRLHATLGSQLSGRFRLRAEKAPTYQLFELVPGALLEHDGLVRPWLVSSAQRISGLTFDYSRMLLPGEPGVRLAYPGEYRVLCAGAEVGRIVVSEAAVARGERVRLDEMPRCSPQP